MIKRILKFMPTLPNKIRSAGLSDTPEYYVKKTMMTSLMLGFALTIIVFSFIKTVYALLTLVLIPFLFMYFLHYADMKILKQDKLVSTEIVFAGRFLVLELESGVPLYNTFQNLADTYEYAGKYFQEVVDMINLGTSTEKAINQVIEYMPSKSLRKLFWQILNSLRTGSEVSDSLRIAIDQIVREQTIEVVEYGRKLNPLAMFYMMMAVIVPSLGTTMIIVMATFIGFKLSLPILLIAAGLLMFIQFMFLAVIRAQRPPVVF